VLGDAVGIFNAWEAVVAYDALTTVAHGDSVDAKDAVVAKLAEVALSE